MLRAVAAAAASPCAECPGSADSLRNWMARNEQVNENTLKKERTEHEVEVKKNLTRKMHCTVALSSSLLRIETPTGGSPTNLSIDSSGLTERRAEDPSNATGGALAIADVPPSASEQAYAPCCSDAQNKEPTPSSGFNTWPLLWPSKDASGSRGGKLGQPRSPTTGRPWSSKLSAIANCSPRTKPHVKHRDDDARSFALRKSRRY